MKKQMKPGPTEQYKDKLRAHVDARTFDDILALSVRILNGLPSDVPFGTLGAAVMLAALAFSESAPHARKLIEEPSA